MKQNEVLAANKEAVELAQSSPGLEEEPNQSIVQGALAHDDRLESKDHNLTNSVAMERTENVTSKSDLHHENDNAERSLQKNLNHETVVGMHSEENGYLLGDMKIKEVNPQGHSSPTAVTTNNISADNGLSTSFRSPVMSNGTIGTLDGLPRVEDLHNGVVINNEPTALPPNQMAEGCVESPGVRLEETVASPSCSQVTTELEDPGRRTCSIDVEIRTDRDITNNNGESCSPTNELASNVVCPLESPGRPEVVNVEARGACQEPNDAETFNPLTHDDVVSNGMPVLRACNFRGQNDMSPLGGKNSVVSPNLPFEVVWPNSLGTSRGRMNFILLDIH